MKKAISVILILSCLITTLCSCDFSYIKNEGVGKTENTAISIYNAISEQMKSRGKQNYNLYGIRMRVNSENVGYFTYIYTNKRPDELKYSDILVVKVNTLTGKIEKFSSPEYDVYGSEPYDMIKSAMPIDPSEFGIDSSRAVKTASAANPGKEYNYIDMSVTYKYGTPLYTVSFISLVDNCMYVTDIDAMTGTVINQSEEEL